MCVLVDQATQKRTWIPLENVIIRNEKGVEHKLGDVLQELEDNKLAKVDFDTYKIETKKQLKKMLNILNVLVGQTELNGLDINEILDNMEDTSNEEK